MPNDGARTGKTLVRSPLPRPPPGRSLLPMRGRSGIDPCMATTEFDIRTPARDAMLDITGQVREAVYATGVDSGTVTVYVPHTTAGVTINENADPDVIHDVLAALDKAVPWRQGFYQHGEGNSAAHVKSSMVGCSTTVPIVGGRLTLGTWQSIFFCEFDGPRTRHFLVTATGEPGC